MAWVRPISRPEAAHAGPKALPSRKRLAPLSGEYCMVCGGAAKVTRTPDPIITKSSYGCCQADATLGLLGISGRSAILNPRTSQSGMRLRLHLFLSKMSSVGRGPNCDPCYIRQGRFIVANEPPIWAGISMRCHLISAADAPSSGSDKTRYYGRRAIEQRDTMFLSVIDG